MGKVKILMLYQDFQGTGESPGFGLFHGTAFSTALVPADYASKYE